MMAILALLTLAMVGGLTLLVVIIAGAVVKAGFHLLFLPFKLLLFPFVALLLVVKLAVVLAVVAAIAAVLIPVALVLGLLVAPFALASAIF